MHNNIIIRGLPGQVVGGDERGVPRCHMHHCNAAVTYMITHMSFAVNRDVRSGPFEQRGMENGPYFGGLIERLALHRRALNLQQDCPPSHHAARPTQLFLGWKSSQSLSTPHAELQCLD